MKAASAAMDTLLATGGPFFMADLYTFTLLSGDVLRYTSADVPLTVGGQTFSNTGPLFTRDKTRLVLGLEADSMTVRAVSDDSVLLLGAPWPQAARLGKLDGAMLRLDRLIAPDWTDTSAGSICMFEGRITDVDATRQETRITAQSVAYMFDQKLPANSYAPGCQRTLYKPGCNVNRVAFAVNGAVTAGSDRRAINSALAQAAGWFDLGTIAFTSGPNAGLVRTVRAFASGRFELSLPLPVVPGVGDTFTAHPGCDKLQSTCSAKFNNLQNFRGYPYVPTPESLL